MRLMNHHVQFGQIPPENTKKAEKPEDLIVEFRDGKFGVNQNPHIGLKDTVIVRHPQVFDSREAAEKEARTTFARLQEQGLL